jgi:tetratricopeptide (TPR) repeat protein
VWDARPLTPELKVELEARGIVEFICTQAKTEEAAIDRIRSNRMISEPVRQQALAFVPTYWAGRLQAEAAHVKALLDKLLLKEEVIATLRADGSLSEAVRQRALGLAERLQENPAHLNNASWRVVRQPGQSLDAYRRALRQAEVACRLAPQNGNYLNTLGVAQYRLGQYQEALATLTRSDQLRSKGSHPADLAFLAMAQHQLGQKEQAQATLARLREAMKNPTWAKNAQAQGFLREAETLIQGKPVAPQP